MRRWDGWRRSIRGSDIIRSWRTRFCRRWKILWRRRGGCWSIEPGTLSSVAFGRSGDTAAIVLRRGVRTRARSVPVRSRPSPCACVRVPCPLPSFPVRFCPLAAERGPELLAPWLPRLARLLLVFGRASGVSGGFLGRGAVAVGVSVGGIQLNGFVEIRDCGLGVARAHIRIAARVVRRGLVRFHLDGLA